MRSTARRWGVSFAVANVAQGALIHDEECGLIYNRARYTQPVLGRSMSRDPFREFSRNTVFAICDPAVLTYVDGMDLYEMNSSNPLVFTDATGLNPGVPVHSQPRKVGGNNGKVINPPFTGAETNLYNAMRQKLDQDFAKLCPGQSYKTAGGGCCKPADCAAQAQQMADAIAYAIVDTGAIGDPGGMGSTIFGWGQCGDWQNIMLTTIQSVENQQGKNGKNSCFNDAAFSGQKLGGLLNHQWSGVETPWGTQILDPWWNPSNPDDPSEVNSYNQTGKWSACPKQQPCK